VSLATRIEKSTVQLSFCHKALSLGSFAGIILLLLNSCSLLCVLNVICHFLLAYLKELYIFIKFGSNCEKSWKSLASVCVLVCTHQEVMGE
jgi:hypothetical protein